MEEKRSQSLEDMLAEVDEECRRLEALVLEIHEKLVYTDASFPMAPSGDPKELWNGNIANIVIMKCMHDSYYLGRIQQWLAAQTLHESR